MKIALLNDTHFGCRNDSPAFMEYQNRFYNEVFFPYIEENNISTLIHLGDVVDRRKFINHNTAHNFKLKFWDKLDELAKLTYHIYPSGGSGFTGTYVNVTIGDLYVNEPMYVTDLSYDWDNETPWVLEEGAQVPLYTTVSMQLGYIGRQRPSYEGAAFTLNTAGADMSTDEDAYYLGG